MAMELWLKNVKNPSSGKKIRYDAADVDDNKTTRVDTGKDLAIPKGASCDVHVPGGAKAFTIDRADADPKKQRFSIRHGAYLTLVLPKAKKLSVYVGGKRGGVRKKVEVDLS